MSLQGPLLYRILVMRQYIKQTCRGMALVMAFPFSALAHAGKWFGSPRMYLGCAQFLSLLPGVTGTFIRSAYYRLTLKRFGKNSVIFMGSVISKMEASIGDWCLISANTSIGLVDIEDKVVIGSGCSIISGGRMHNFSNPARGPLEIEGIYTRVHIGEKTFVGDRSVIMCNVGKQVVIGAGSVVAKEIVDLVVVAGNPARVIKQR